MHLPLTKQAIDEMNRYHLNHSGAYFSARLREIEAAEKRFKRYGYYIEKSIPNRNMIKALRMHPWSNSAEDWARLHVTESLMRKKQ